jgi:hypothetical protein
MQFHKGLIITFSISVIASFIFFFLIILIEDPDFDETGLLVVLGWIAWLGIFSFFVHVFAGPSKISEWFREKFFYGTLILCLTHYFHNSRIILRSSAFE